MAKVGELTYGASLTFQVPAILSRNQTLAALLPDLVFQFLVESPSPRVKTAVQS